MTQKELILKLYQNNKDAIFIGSLGTISKDLDGTNAIRVKGAMGVVMGIGLGYALNTKKKVIVIVGEGSFLMHAGSISTILRYKLPNLRVIIIDNGCYKSCGGQKNNFKYIKKYIKNLPNFKIWEVQG